VSETVGLPVLFVVDHDPNALAELIADISGVSARIFWSGATRLLAAHSARSAS
jgi:hypothetical protein